MFRGVGGSRGKGTRREGVGIKSKADWQEAGNKGETRMIECGGVLGSLVRSDEGRSEERGEKKT